MMPKCTGSTPKALATGRKIGVQMMISGARSMNVPSTSRISDHQQQDRDLAVGETVRDSTAAAGTCR